MSPLQRGTCQIDRKTRVAGVNIASIFPSDAPRFHAMRTCSISLRRANADSIQCSG
ncbi:hypothetical protein X946_5594 [Burkholderia sp. ABCPW 111]|nr:hypothetical protein X946_5594 [Burkholderia sp. ABCPW 111]